MVEFFSAFKYLRKDYFEYVFNFVFWLFVWFRLLLWLLDIRLYLYIYIILFLGIFYIFLCVAGYTSYYRNDIRLSKVFWENYESMDADIKHLDFVRTPKWLHDFNNRFYKYTEGKYVLIFIFFAFIYPTAYGGFVKLNLLLLLYVLFFFFMNFINVVNCLYIFVYYGYWKNELGMNPRFLRVIYGCVSRWVNLRFIAKCFSIVVMVGGGVVVLDDIHHKIFPEVVTPIDTFYASLREPLQPIYDPTDPSQVDESLLLQQRYVEFNNALLNYVEHQSILTDVNLDLSDEERILIQQQMQQHLDALKKMNNNAFLEQKYNLKASSIEHKNSIIDSKVSEKE